MGPGVPVWREVYGQVDSYYIAPHITNAYPVVKSTKEDLIELINSKFFIHKLDVQGTNLETTLKPYGISGTALETIKNTLHSKVNTVEEIKFVISVGKASVSGIKGKVVNRGNGNLHIDFVQGSVEAKLKALKTHRHWHKRSQCGHGENWEDEVDREPLETETAMVQRFLTDEMFKLAEKCN